MFVSVKYVYFSGMLQRAKKSALLSAQRVYYCRRNQGKLI